MLRLRDDGARRAVAGVVVSVGGGLIARDTSSGAFQLEVEAEVLRVRAEGLPVLQLRGQISYCLPP